MRKTIWFFILIFLVIIVIGFITLKYFLNSNYLSINEVKNEPKEISYIEYDNLAYKNMVQFYNSSEGRFYYKYLYPKSKGITLELLKQKGIDIKEDERICSVALYGSVLPDESKFVFAIDFFTERPGSSIPPCDFDYDPRYNFYIFDVNTKEIISLPQGSVPIIWIDKDNLLYEKATSRPSDLQNLKTNLYLYDIKENKHTKLSSYELSSGRKDIDDFAISPNNDKIFIEDHPKTGTMNNYYNYLVIPLNENQKELRIEISECSKIPIPNPRNPIVVGSIPCGKFTWSKDGKSILYLYKTDVNESFKIVNIY